jgi:N-acyl-D-aspartate/D-glutamate deacylase
VTADAYPYAAGFAELGVVLPDSFYQDPQRVARFKDPVQRDALLKTLGDYYETHPASWDRIRVATVASEKNLNGQGKSLQEIAEATHRSPLEVLVDLLGDEEFKVSAFYFSQSELVVNRVLSKSYVAVGSDSIADGSASPHPRAYGTFPKRLAQCPKQGGVMTSSCWGQVIHQMTGFPAKILGLGERGRIGTGFFADLVLFDPRVVQDQADYQNPKAPPEGIQWVFVNGKPVVRQGRYDPVHSGLFVTREK